MGSPVAVIDHISYADWICLFGRRRNFVHSRERHPPFLTRRSSASFFHMSYVAQNGLLPWSHDFPRELLTAYLDCLE
jgi:hypothetical protein